MRSVLCGLALTLSAPAHLHAAQVEKPASERAAEINAKCWFNAQPVRLHDAPKLILLEFWSARSRESREFMEVLAKEYEASRDGRLLVVALSEDKCEDARDFIRREKILYKVGAESHSAKDYNIEELPGVVLIDPKDLRIVARWSGREVKAKTIAKAIQDFLGPPKGTVPSSGALPYAELQVLSARVAEMDDQLATITSQILAMDGEIGPEALSPLDQFYAQNVPEDPDLDDGVTRAQGVARSAIVGDLGYEKLFASGRLSEAAKTAIRDRVLEIAAKDPSVRIQGVGALRRFIGRPGDPVVLEGLRGMLARETEGPAAPIFRAAIDHALEELDPTRAAAKRQDRWTQPIALKVLRMLKESPDPASSVWADAHAYKQTVSKRTTEQLIEDYRAFPDPPDDEVGLQNAALKRAAATTEILHRMAREEIRDLRLIKDHFARALVEEPDPFIRKYVAWSGLRTIAQGGDSGLRAEIVDLFEKRFPLEPDRDVKAMLEIAISELKGK
jgi:hypothetical protein